MEIDFDLLYRFVIAIDVLLCAAIILCNFLLLFSILCYKKARARTRNVMLVSMCLADLLVGAFTHPIYIHSYHTGTLFHSCEMHIVMQLIGDYSQDFICFWTLVTLGSIYMYRLVEDRRGWGAPRLGQYGRLTPSPSRCSTFVRLSKKALVVGWPWLGSLLIPIPILMANVDQRTVDAFWDETFCPLHTPFPSRMVVLVLVFYLPMAALLLLCVGLALLMHWDTVHAGRSFTTSASASSLAFSSCAESTTTTTNFTTSTATSGGPAEEGDRGRVNGHLEGKVVVREGSAGLLDHAEPMSDDQTLAAVRDGGDADRGTSSSSSSFSQRAIMHSQAMDPSVILVGGDSGGDSGGGGGRRGGSRGGRGRRGEEDDTNTEPLERPGHILTPLLVTVVCALPLMVGWWFYRQMPRDTVIIVSVTLSRVYLLRAALLPLAWFALPELRHAAARLWDRLSGRRGSSTARETGEFSVAYTTLRESGDGPASACCEEGREREVRRQNPFDPDFVRA